MEITGSLTVVVIGRNEGDRLEHCLRSISAMENPGLPVEVIYVDSASTDGSPQLARRLQARVVEMRPARPTAALGRNAGWTRASGDFILFLDGDTILDPQFVVRALPEFRDERVAIVWGHRREINPKGSIYNRVLDLDWISRPGWTECCGGDALVRRSSLEQVGGFDEDLIAGEEPEMCRRLRGLDYKILHVGLAMTRHDLAITRWAQYWKRAQRTGYAYAEVSDRFRATGLPFWNREARANRDRALVLLFAPALAAADAIAFRTWLPLICLAALFSLLVARTAWKTRWKSDGFWTSILYGLHSHVQQIPIFFGQLQYSCDARGGQRRGLIEYKQV